MNSCHMRDKIVEQSGIIVRNSRWRQSWSPTKRNDCLHDNDTNMPDVVTTELGLPNDKNIVVNRRSTTIILNMTKAVVDLRDLSRPTKTLPDLSRLHHAYVRD